MDRITYNSSFYTSHSQKERNSSSINEILLCGAMGVLGTFGTGSTHPIIPKDRNIQRYIVPKENLSAVNVVNDFFTVAKPISEQLQNIRDSLQLNMTHLADLLLVSRPSVYTWLKGENPTNADVIKKIQNLENVSKRIASLELARVDNLIKRPIFEGLSMFELLKNGSVIENSHLLLLKELDTKEVQARLNNTSSKGIKSFKDTIQDISIPTRF